MTQPSKLVPPIDKHVIDTNVLLVASAAHDSSPFLADATPVEEIHLRRRVLEWLMAFEVAERSIVLDFGWKIFAEYKGENRRAKLTEQDYGLLVVLQKYSTGKALSVSLQWESPQRARIDHPELTVAIKDDADRKMVAAVLAAGCAGGGCNLVNACDTDWYDCQPQLEAADIFVEQLIGNEWCHPIWQKKQAR